MKNLLAAVVLLAAIGIGLKPSRFLNQSGLGTIAIGNSSTIEPAVAFPTVDELRQYRMGYTFGGVDVPADSCVVIHEISGLAARVDEGWVDLVHLERNARYADIYRR